MSDTVLYDSQDQIAIITLNRPERHNALNRDAYKCATELFDRANQDKNIRCVVFTGAGKSFGSGDDVVEIMAAGDGLAGSLKRDESTPTITPPIAVAMQQLRCPIINAVNGAAVGFGMELTLLCDIRIASSSARFSEMFIRRGIIATNISYDLLPGIVGPAMAAEMLLTGDIIDAKTALQAGLVSKVVASEELMDSALQLAGKIAANAPLAVERAKQALRLKRDHRLQEMETYLAESLRFLAGTKDHQESVKAYLEKRLATYIGE